MTPERVFLPVVSEPNCTRIPGYAQLLSHWMGMDQFSQIRSPALILTGRHDLLLLQEKQTVSGNRQRLRGLH